MWTDDMGGKFPPRGGGEVWHEETMGAWPFVLYNYMSSMDEEIWLCPAATKPYIEGGRPPFAAWDDEDDPKIYGSYISNFWVANEPEPKFWRTPSAKGIANTPVLMDGNWKDCEPEPDDEPPPYATYWWQPNQNEMKRVCLARHGRHVNSIFGDWSAHKVPLKSLWRTKWHRLWDWSIQLPHPSWFPGTAFAGDWPPWMKAMPEPVRPEL